MPSQRNAKGTIGTEMDPSQSTVYVVVSDQGGVDSAWTREPEADLRAGSLNKRTPEPNYLPKWGTAEVSIDRAPEDDC